MEPKYQELITRLKQVNDINSAIAILSWDQSTYMPAGGAEARARQMATLEAISHERFTDPAIGKLLDDLKDYEKSLPYDADAAAMLRIARREYEREVKVPTSFAAEFAGHTALVYDAWTRARPANDFASVRPLLEKTLDYSRQYANFFPGYEHIADPLIDNADYGMKVSSVRAVFADLRTKLVPMVEAITAQPPADDSCLNQPFGAKKQLGFGVSVVKQFGYDFKRGRQDLTHHPFETTFAWGDVRITTRVKPNDLSEAIFSTMHESGHAMYEQGSNKAYDGTPLAGGTSSGVHESQSRTWENIVGRSRGFWEFYYPSLQKVFPAQLGSVPLDTFYRAINKVQRSLIRTDADEVTYNLHVIIRFDLELAMLEGKLAIKDLPEAWRARYKSDIGVSAPSDVDGCLQDVHWYSWFIGGYFQGYTLGNIMSAQFYATALKAHPEIPTEIRQGKFATLHGWLKDNIYDCGSKYTAAELLQRVTGGPLNVNPYIKYLKTKYGELYKLS
jgi:carboxypeptidase Taq